MGARAVLAAAGLAAAGAGVVVGLAPDPAAAQVTSVQTSDGPVSMSAICLVEHFDAGNGSATDRFCDGSAHVAYRDALTGVGWDLWVGPGIDVTTFEDGSARVQAPCGLDYAAMDLVETVPGAFGTGGEGSCGYGPTSGSAVFPTLW
jgi:hypothetical protein